MASIFLIAFNDNTNQAILADEMRIVDGIREFFVEGTLKFALPEGSYKFIRNEGQIGGNSKKNNSNKTTQ